MDSIKVIVFGHPPSEKRKPEARRTPQRLSSFINQQGHSAFPDSNSSVRK
jgi:hypothetical protein